MLIGRQGSITISLPIMHYFVILSYILYLITVTIKHADWTPGLYYYLPTNHAQLFNLVLYKSQIHADWTPGPYYYLPTNHALLLNIIVTMSYILYFTTVKNIHILTSINPAQRIN
jgi:hypothetical protein